MKYSEQCAIWAAEYGAFHSKIVSGECDKIDLLIKFNVKSWRELAYYRAAQWLSNAFALAHMTACYNNSELAAISDVITTEAGILLGAIDDYQDTKLSHDDILNGNLTLHLAILMESYNSKDVTDLEK